VLCKTAIRENRFEDDVLAYSNRNMRYECLPAGQESNDDVIDKNK
jgi:hypothetical protein